MAVGQAPPRSSMAVGQGRCFNPQQHSINTSIQSTSTSINQPVLQLSDQYFNCLHFWSILTHYVDLTHLPLTPVVNQPTRDMIRYSPVPATSSPVDKSSRATTESVCPKSRAQSAIAAAHSGRDFHRIRHRCCCLSSHAARPAPQSL